MQKLLLSLLFISACSLATAQSTNNTRSVEAEAPQMETVEKTNTMRGAASTQSAMASFHNKAIQRLHESVDMIQEEEDTEIFPSESAKNTDF